MRKRLNLASITDKLAEEMWGKIMDKIECLSGLLYYKCQYYEGFVFNSKDFNVDKELEKKISPDVIIEIYSYRGEKFILERTNKNEKIPDKLVNKYNNKKFDDRILIYALADESIEVLKYYHKDVLKAIYNKKLEERAKEYKSVQGYINRSMKDLKRNIALKYPEFVKKKDRKEAKDYLNSVLEKKLKAFELKKQKYSLDEIEDIRDSIAQKIEVLCTG